MIVVILFIEIFQFLYFVLLSELVLDVPHKGFLKDLATNETLKSLLKQTKSTGVEVVVHFTPNAVFTSLCYQYCIENINPKRNLVVNDSNK